MLMLKFLGNLFWHSPIDEGAPGAGSVGSRSSTNDGVAAFSGTDWSSGFVGYVLDNETLWYSERHLVQEWR